MNTPVSYEHHRDLLAELWTLVFHTEHYKANPISFEDMYSEDDGKHQVSGIYISWSIFDCP